MTDAHGLPKLPWWVRLSVWSANYPRISAGFPSWPRPRPIAQDVQCMIWGCDERYIVKSWRKPIRTLPRAGCVHQTSDQRQAGENC